MELFVWLLRETVCHTGSQMELRLWNIDSGNSNTHVHSPGLRIAPGFFYPETSETILKAVSGVVKMRRRQGCTNPCRPTIFCMAAFDVAFVTLAILRWLQHFWGICIPLE